MVLAVLVGLVGLTSGTRDLWAQAVDVEVEPITCWWRASTGSVRVGEPFSIVLTCAVVETTATRVVPDQSRLDPAVMQLPPFEVTGGARGADVRTASRRFFQYEYQLRLMTENLFGAEATVPPVQVSYRVETRAGQGEATQGRDLTYQLPALTVRVAALVPDSTRDIRETAGVPLREIDGLRLRESTLRLTGGLLMAVGVLLVLTGLVRAVRRGLTSTTAGTATMPAREVLRDVHRTLSSVRSESQQTGWSPEIAGQASAALRIAASYALGRPVAQRPLTNGARAMDGQLTVGGGWTRRVSTSISGGVTAEALSRELANTNGTSSQLMLEELRDALARLTAARYGRGDQPDLSSLDDAVAGGMRATERLAAEHTWMADAQRAVTTWITTTTSRMWKR